MAAIREALRHFSADDNRQQWRVGAVRSPAELEDLWAIDKAAHEDASITYESFHEWWSSFPLGLRALFFRNRGTVPRGVISKHYFRQSGQKLEDIQKFAL